MSLATRCTSCGTIFRVVQDQLKVSEGWVRCGRCQKVFNALEALFDLERESPPQRVRPPAPLPSGSDLVARGMSEFVASHLPYSEPKAATDLPATHEEDALESRFLPPPAEEGIGPGRRDEESAEPGERPEFADARFPSESPLDDKTADRATAVVQSGHAEAAGIQADARPRSTPLLERWRARRAARRGTPAAEPPPVPVEPQEPVQEPVQEHVRTEVMPAPAFTPPSTADESSLMDTKLFSDDSMLVGELPEPPDAGEERARFEELAELVGPPPAGATGTPATPAFVRAAENAERWQRPRVRASLAAAAVLLLGLLMIQVAVQFRDSFAARWSQARPALAAMCQALGCDIGPLKRVAALSVDASGLSPADGSDTYRLTLTLRNRDQVELAAPSVELSLTDSRGELVVRRALAPAEFRHAPDGAPLGLSLPPGTDTQIQTEFTIRGTRISGYTVELFYP